MISDPDPFKHNQSAYERPNSKFRCGRECAWQKPCTQGPNPDGSCGGITECTPFKNKDHYECRRPVSAGGPCAEGPLPDGRCSRSRIACVPLPALRVVRGRVAIFVFALTISVIAALLHFIRSSDMLNPLNPGPLTASHARFTEKAGCASCHEGHGKTLRESLERLFGKSDPSSKCLSCHAFNGPAESGPSRSAERAENMEFRPGDAPHNKTFERPENAKGTSAIPVEKNIFPSALFGKESSHSKTTCVMCHTEHRGADFKNTRMSDAQCSACHQTKFESFSKGHPAFPANFPYVQRMSVQFDHNVHLNKYFKDPNFVKMAPENCTSCHAVNQNTGQIVKTGGFENCAACHAPGISKKEWVLFRLPQMSAPVDPSAVKAACRPDQGGEQAAVEKPETSDPVPSAAPGAEAVPAAPVEFENISFEEQTSLSAFLMGADTGDGEKYQGPVNQFLIETIEQGPAPLAGLLEKYAGKERSQVLLSGLNPEVLKQAACAWASNMEYGGAAPPEGYRGWYADLLELKYRPAGHADPVLKSWIDFLTQYPADSFAALDAETQKRFGALKQEFHSKGGAGACMTCHSVRVQKENDKEIPRVDWQFRPREEWPHTRFSHGIHFKILGAADSCARCHELNLQADYAASFNDAKAEKFASSFSGIKKETCMECHGSGKKSEGKVREDCLLCHRYHENSRMIAKV